MEIPDGLIGYCRVEWESTVEDDYRIPLAYFKIRYNEDTEKYEVWAVDILSKDLTESRELNDTEFDRIIEGSDLKEVTLELGEITAKIEDHASNLDPERWVARSIFIYPNE